MSKKVLYISDSLGTPIHPRGIYYYSVALVEVLIQQGFSVDLMVEKTDGFGEPEFLDLSRSSGVAARDAFLSSEIFRYFWQREFSARLELRDNVYGNLLEVDVKQADRFGSSCEGEREDKVFRRSAHLDFKRNFISVKNLHHGQEMYSEKGKHLGLFSGFLWGDYVYTDSMSYAVNDLPPPEVSALGYDLVIIDTPHYVKVKDIDKSGIYSVVHDLIPVRDFSTHVEWRKLFMEKLKATLLHEPTMIFVSEFTRDLFKKEIPDFYNENNILIHPTIKDEDIKKSSVQKSKNDSTYISKLSSIRKNDKEFNIREQIKHIWGDKIEKDNRDLIALNEEYADWNPDLPFFCTALSDEPRKNIGIIVDISKKFVGQANFIVMGKVNGNHHMKHMPLDFPNLHFAGYVSEEDKDDIFRHAHGVIFPSFAEGFGIPLVEGALYKKPVLCSDIAVFREIAKDYAIYFDPYDVGSLEAAINTLLSNPAPHNEAAQRLYPTLLERYSQNAMLRVVAQRF